MHRSGRSKKEKSLHNPPTPNPRLPSARIGVWGEKPQEGKEEGLGRERGTPRAPAQLNARLWQGKENKVNFGNQMTVLADSSPLLQHFFLQLQSIYFCSAASGKRRAERTHPIFSVAASGNG